MVGTDGRYRCHGDPLGFIVGVSSWRLKEKLRIVAGRWRNGELTSSSSVVLRKRHECVAVTADDGENQTNRLRSMAIVES